MILSKINYINLVVVFETLIAAHMIAYYLPKRSHFIIRFIYSAVPCLIIGLLFYNPQLEDPALKIIYTIVMYSALAVIPGIGVLACRKMTIWEFLFCVSGGHALHQLAGQFHDFIAQATRIKSLDAFIYNTLDIVIWASTLIVTYAIFFYVFVLKKKVNRDIAVQRHKVILLNLVVVLVNIVLSSCVLFMTKDIGAGLSIVIAGYNLMAVALEMFVLFSYLAEKRLENEVQTINILWKENAKQYEIAKQCIDMINIKCHDMKHRIEKLADGDDHILAEALCELKENISIYDSVIKTGNDALDVILTEKSLYCEKNAITFSVIADGSLLNFISSYDLYCLFENAISNAIEAVMRLKETKKRSISLTIKGAERMVSVHIENFFDGDIVKDDEEIKTQKSDELNHGFGTKSMKLIVKKYQGTISFASEDNIFLLDIIFPL